MKNLSYVLVMIFALASLQSCVKEKDPVIDNGVQPELPPIESFVMPFNGFEDADTTGLTPGNDEGATVRTTTFDNWFYSVTNVIVWNTIIAVNTAIPVASFREAFNHNPTPQGSGVWLWAYSVTGDDGATYEAKLYGEVLAIGEVQWDMYISKVGGFTDVNWYSGITSNNGETANWTLNHKPNNPEAFLQIDYTNNTGNGAAIRYTNIIPSNPGMGSYIEFRRTNDPAVNFNRAYDIFKVENNNLLEINWHETNKNGRVKDEVRFGDQEWHCWDVDAMDVDC